MEEEAPAFLFFLESGAVVAPLLALGSRQRCERANCQASKLHFVVCAPAHCNDCRFPCKAAARNALHKLTSSKHPHQISPPVQHLSALGPDRKSYYLTIAYSV